MSVTHNVFDSIFVRDKSLRTRFPTFRQELLKSITERPIQMSQILRLEPIDGVINSLDQTVQLLYFFVG